MTQPALKHHHRRPIYGQVVVGPPGSGKTTFCNGMQQYLRLLGRQVGILNLDPANTVLPYEDEDNNAVIWNVRTEIVNLSSVMQETELGPNGGLLYCMEYLEAHADEIIATKLRPRLNNCNYILLDFPGQVELYTHSPCVHRFLHRVIKALDLRLTMVQLIDSQYCTEASKFLSATLLGTTTMIRLELPAVNVLSKVDLMAQYGNDLPMQLDFFTDCQDLDRLLPFIAADFHDSEGGYQQHGDDGLSLSQEGDSYADDPEYQAARRKRLRSPLQVKFAKLHEAIAGIVQDFGLLHFLPLDISSAESVGRVLAQIDKSNGYIFTQQQQNGGVEDLFQSAIAQNEMAYEVTADIRERISSRDEIPELVRKNGATKDPRPS